MNKCFKLNYAYLRKLAKAQWERHGRKGAFLDVVIDYQDGHIYFDTMVDRFQLVGYVITKVKGIWRLLTEKEAEDHRFDGLFATIQAYYTEQH